MLYEIVEQISKNIDDKTQTSQAEYYTLLNLIKNIPEIKKYEKGLAKNSTTSKSTSKSFSPKFMQRCKHYLVHYYNNHKNDYTKSYIFLEINLHHIFQAMFHHILFQLLL